VKRRALVVLGLVLLFFLFFDASKHDPVLASASAFLEDPYDAVGSFGVQLAVLAALLSLVRAFRPYPAGQAPTSQTLLILRGNVVALLAVAATLAADVVAMIRYPSTWAQSGPGWLLGGLVAGLALLTALAGWTVLRAARVVELRPGRRPWGKAAVACLAGLFVLALYPASWQQSVPGGLLAVVAGMVCLFVPVTALAKAILPAAAPYEDTLDDLAAIYRAAQGRAPFAAGLFRQVDRLASAPRVRAVTVWLNPRRYPWRWIVLLALGMGVALALAEAIGEGVSSSLKNAVIVAAVLVSMEGGGVLLGYALLGRFLGIFRPERAR
jgi:hypothetical protein